MYKTTGANQISLALGKISLNNVGGNQFSINPDYYDFNIEWENGFSKRNIATFNAAILHRLGQMGNPAGGPYWIYFDGTVTINP